MTEINVQALTTPKLSSTALNVLVALPVIGAVLGLGGPLLNPAFPGEAVMNLSVALTVLAVLAVLTEALVARIFRARHTSTVLIRRGNGPLQVFEVLLADADHDRVARCARQPGSSVTFGQIPILGEHIAAVTRG